MQNSRGEDFVLVFCAHGEVRKTVDAAFIWFVEDFPVDEPSIPCKTDAAAADTAQRKADLASLCTSIYLVAHS